MTARLKKIVAGQMIVVLGLWCVLAARAARTADPAPAARPTFTELAGARVRAEARRPIGRPASPGKPAPASAPVSTQAFTVAAEAAGEVAAADPTPDASAPTPDGADLPPTPAPGAEEPADTAFAAAPPSGAAGPAGAGAQGPAPVKPVADLPGLLRFRSRAFIPEPTLEVPPADEPGLATRHFIVQFDGPLPADAEERLTRGGLTPLHFVAPNAVAVAAPPELAKVEVPGVRAVFGTQPEDRIAPPLAARLEGEETTGVLIQFYPDVTREQATALVTAAGANAQETPGLPASMLVVAKADGALIDALAAREAVAWIVEAPAAALTGQPVHACAGAHTPVGTAAPFVLGSEGWDGPGQNPITLRYVFVNSTRDLATSVQRSEVVRAMNAWSRYARVTWQANGVRNGSRTIEIGWFSGAHLGEPAFPANVLAHCYYPAPPNREPIAGDVHFNDGFLFRAGASPDLFSVALHELGHGLGLDHSSDPNAVMYPVIQGVYGDLRADDIAGIQRIYAAAGSAPPPADDHGDTPATATVLSTDALPVAGRIERAGDADYFRLTLPAGASCTVFTGALADGMDTVLRIENAAGAVLGQNDDEGGGVLTSRVTFTAPAGGAYYARIVHYDSGATSGRYTISARLGTPVTRPRTPANLSPVEGATVDGAAVTLSCSAYSHPAGVAGAAALWQVRRADGNYDAPVFALERTDSLVACAVPAERLQRGVRYVWRVAHRDAERNLSDYSPESSFTTRAAIVDDHADTPAGATVLRTDGSPVTGAVQRAGDLDYFQFPVRAGERMLILTSGMTAAMDTWIDLLDRDGLRVLASDDDGNPQERLASRLAVTLPTAGVYFVRLRHYNAGAVSGGYRISVLAQSVSLPPARPRNLAPAHGATVADLLPLLTAGAYAHPAGSAHVASEWQVRDGAGALAVEVLSTVARTEFRVPDGALRHATTYTWSVRHQSAAGVFSERSAATAFVTPGRPDDHGNTPQTASAISTDGRELAGAIQYAGDVDVFAFVGEEHQRYRLRTSGLTGGMDTVIQVLAADGATVLAQDDDGSELERLASRIDLRAPATGRFYIRLVHYSSGATAGGYHLSVTDLDDAAPPAGRLEWAPAPSGDFGTLTVRSAARRTFTLRNTGSATASGQLLISGRGFRIESGDGAYAIPANGSLSVTVVFDPDLRMRYAGALIAVGADANAGLNLAAVSRR